MTKKTGHSPCISKCGIVPDTTQRQIISKSKGETMSSNSLLLKPTSRRAMLRNSATLASSAFLAQLFPASLRAAFPWNAPQQSSPADPVAAFRAQMGANPIQAQKLADNLTMLSGPGGNVCVLNGPDGKLVVDTFVQPAWPKLKE